MNRIFTVSIIFAMFSLVIPLSNPAFAQTQFGGVPIDGEWYVGESLEEGNFFQYELCYFDHNRCTGFELNLRVLEELENWKFEFSVIDENIVLTEQVELDKKHLRPINPSEEFTPYANAFKYSIPWLSHFANSENPKAFSDHTWGKIGNIGGEQIVPTSFETITVPAGTFDTVVISWKKGGSISKIWVADGIPFPIKAETWIGVAEGVDPLDYKFQLTSTNFVLHEPVGLTIQSNGVGGGNWNDGTTWSGGVIPTPIDTVTIKSGDVVIVPSSIFIKFGGKITVEEGAKLIIGTEKRNFIVTDVISGSLLKVTSDGIVSTIASGFDFPVGVAIDSSGDYIVISSNGDKLSRITPSGVVSEIASGLRHPQGIAIDSGGDFIITNDRSHLTRVTPDGTITTISKRVGDAQGISIDFDGNFVVADLNGKLLKVTPSGKVSAITRHGLGNPYDVAIDSNGEFIVTDVTGNLLKVTPDGEISTITSGLRSPFGVAIESNGDFIVASLNGILYRVTPAGIVSIIADGLGASWGVAIEPANQFNKKSNGSSAKSYLNKPTFGLSHATGQRLVEDGFTANDNSFTITDNWHTEFEKQTIHVGEVNTFSAKSYSSFGLQWIEFMFGIPEVGKSHEAEAVVEVWLDRNGDVDNIQVNQKDNLIDSTTLFVVAEMTKCTSNSGKKNCNLITISASFNEAPLNDVFALQGVDFTRRNHITYLNEGFSVQGESLNEPKTVMVASKEKGVGLVELTLLDKRNNIWFDDSGVKYYKNTFGSFLQESPEFVERDDPLVNVITRQNSNFEKIIEYEVNRAGKIFDSSELISKLPTSFAYVYPESHERITDEMRSEILDQEEIAKKILESDLQARW